MKMMFMTHAEIFSKKMKKVKLVEDDYPLVKSRKKGKTAKKLIRDIDSSEVHTIFKKIQDERGITDGGTDPCWTMELDVKLEDKGMTKEELTREINKYYDTLYG